MQRKHPWVFSGAVKRTESTPNEGDLVEVLNHKGRYLATGHWQNGSIVVRIISFIPTEADLSFWIDKITDAYQLRKKLGLVESSETNCFRLIHAEGDGLPGLIIDIYGKTAVIQCHSIGMHKQQELINQAVQQVLGEQIHAVYSKSKETLPDKYSSSLENKYLLGSSSEATVLENGYQFFVSWEKGQKTGFFLDQRINRQLLSRYVKGKRVLNAFCYSGGFSVYAAQAGAISVDSVDISEKAIVWTDKNMALNAKDECQHQSYAQDVLKYLKTCSEYDVLVIDPPAFAKSRNKKHNAVQGYKRLNIAAIKKTKPGGILFTFSCSQVIDRQLFYNTIVAAAIEAQRKVRVLHHLSQPPDHPVSLFHPEGSYLKGLVLEVGE